MKRLYILLIFCTAALASSAQLYQTDATFGKVFNRVLPLYNMGVPPDTTAPPATYQNYPHLAAKDSILYLWSPSGHYFRAITGAATGGGGGSYTFLAPLSNNGGVVSITSLPWSLITGAPTTLSGYGIQDAVRYQDTALMLSPYVRKGTTGTGTDTLTFVQGLIQSGKTVYARYGTPMWNANRVQGYLWSPGQPMDGAVPRYSALQGMWVFDTAGSATLDNYVDAVSLTGKTLTLSRTGVLADLSVDLSPVSGSNYTGLAPIYINSTQIGLDTTAVATRPWTKHALDSLKATITESDPLYTANGVAKTRTLTINGQAYDLSQNRSWTIQTASGTDSAAYHTISPLADSSGYVINRPNGTKDTVQFVGATVTAPTVDTTSLSNRINQKQNISDTLTVDATRYWVNSQGFAKQSALQDSASAIRSAIGTGSVSGGVLVRAWGDSAAIPAATTVDSHRRWTVPANTLAQAGDMLIMRIWFTVNGTESVTINFRATPAGMTPASIVGRGGANMSTVGNEVVMELTRLTATTYSLRTLLQSSGGFPSDQFSIAPASVLDFTKDITFCIGIVTGTTNTAVTPRMVQYRIIKN